MQWYRHIVVPTGGREAVGKREENASSDGQKDDYDHTQTKPVEESGGGRHDQDDK